MNKMKKEIKVEVTKDTYIYDNKGEVIQGLKEGEQFVVKLNNDTWKFICGEIVVAEYNYFGKIKMHDGFKLIQGKLLIGFKFEICRKGANKNEK